MTREEEELRLANSRGRGFFFGAGGGHNIEGCDMCQTLIAQGVARSCIKKKMVVFDVTYDAENRPIHTVVDTR